MYYQKENKKKEKNKYKAESNFQTKTSITFQREMVWIIIKFSINFIRLILENANFETQNILYWDCPTFQ